MTAARRRSGHPPGATVEQFPPGPRDGDEDEAAEAAGGEADDRTAAEATSEASGPPADDDGDGDGDGDGGGGALEPDRPDETVDGRDGHGRPDRPKLQVGKTPGVAADDTIAEAGRKVLRFHFARMLAREAGTRQGADPEELHSMRVATRRMRAAWRVFGDGFRRGRTRRLRRPLREIAGRLGAVRDLDVLLEAIEAHRAELPDGEARALEPLVSTWRSDREAARAVLVRELDSDAYLRFVEDFRVFVATDGAGALPVAATAPHRVRDTMPSRILAAYGDVRAYETVLRWADVETLHDLRIAAKRLRYTVEFVREPLGEGVEPLIARIVALQDHLGLLNDANVTAGLARELLVSSAGRLSPAESATIGRYLVERERDVARLRRSVGRPWRGVAGTGFRRGLGRVIAGL